MFRHFIQIQTRPCYLLWFLFINSRKSKQIVDFSNTQGLLYFFFRRNRWTLRYRLFQRHPPLVRDKSHILKSILVSGLPFAVSSAPITLNWKATGKQHESNWKETGKKLESRGCILDPSWKLHQFCFLLGRTFTAWADSSMKVQRRLPCVLNAIFSPHFLLYCKPVCKNSTSGRRNVSTNNYTHTHSHTHTHTNTKNKIK